MLLEGGGQIGQGGRPFDLRSGVSGAMRGIP
jgi:hypothetical protein